MFKWIIPMISTAVLTLPLVAFSANEKPAPMKPKPAAKEMTKSNTALGKTGMAGKSDGGDKPKPEKPPKKEAMNKKASQASMVGKSDGGDKPKPEKPPKKDAMRAGTTMSR